MDAQHGLGVLFKEEGDICQNHTYGASAGAGAGLTIFGVVPLFQGKQKEREVFLKKKEMLPYSFLLLLAFTPPPLRTATRKEVIAACFHPQVHGMGNTGAMGAWHAALLPFAWEWIRISAFKGRDVREDSIHLLPESVKNRGRKPPPFAVDVGCSVGHMASSLRKSGFDVLGVDSSPEMIRFAKWMGTGKGIRWEVKNACLDTLPQADLFFFSFVMHEMPLSAQHISLSNAVRSCKNGGCVCVLDIHPSAASSAPPRPRTGFEPYLSEYSKNIRSVVKRVASKHGKRVEEKELGGGSCSVWILK